LRVLSVATVAQMLGLTRAMIRKAIRKGTLRAINIAAPGERPIYVVEPEEVERYRREHLGRVGRRRARR
jgi:excisionase family DNA binding protein